MAGMLAWLLAAVALMLVAIVVVELTTTDDAPTARDPRRDPARCPPMDGERIFVTVVAGPRGDECWYFDMDTGRSLNPTDPVMARPLDPTG